MKQFLKELFHLHDWIFLGEQPVVLPKCGPFDPRDDESRTVTRWKSVCAECGAEKTEEPRYDYGDL